MNDHQLVALIAAVLIAPKAWQQNTEKMMSDAVEGATTLLQLAKEKTVGER
jgi:hypothetical protein